MEEVKRRGRPAKQMKNLTIVPSIIDFSQITKLNALDINPRMLESMPSGIKTMDEFFSHENGVPCASNVMIIGDPGVGKTTIMLDVLSSIQNKGTKFTIF